MFWRWMNLVGYIAINSDSLASFINSYSDEPEKEPGTNPVAILIVISFTLIWISVLLFLIFKKKER